MQLARVKNIDDTTTAVASLSINTGIPCLRTVRGGRFEFQPSRLSKPRSLQTDSPHIHIIVQPPQTRAPHVPNAAQ